MALGFQNLFGFLVTDIWNFGAMVGILVYGYRDANAWVPTHFLRCKGRSLAHSFHLGELGVHRVHAGARRGHHPPPEQKPA